jgi:ABC-type transport system involved in cytochrome c biogenesis ATPase subunit
MLPELPSRVTVHSYLRRMASGSQREEITEAVIHFFNFEDVLQERAGRLSPGWQKRLQLAKLFFSEKKVWLLDHPAALLDTEGQHMLEGLISTRREQGGLILYTLPADDIPPHEGEVPDGIHYLNLADFKASDS